MQLPPHWSSEKHHRYVPHPVSVPHTREGTRHVQEPFHRCRRRCSSDLHRGRQRIEQGFHQLDRRASAGLRFAVGRHRPRLHDVLGRHLASTQTSSRTVDFTIRSRGHDPGKPHTKPRRAHASIASPSVAQRRRRKTCWMPRAFPSPRPPGAAPFDVTPASDVQWHRRSILAPAASAPR